MGMMGNIPQEIQCLTHRYGISKKDLSQQYFSHLDVSLCSKVYTVLPHIIYHHRQKAKNTIISYCI